MLMRNGMQSALDDRIEPSSGRSINAGGSLDLHSVWTILRRRARLIVAVTLATIALAAAAIVVLPPNYAATTIVLIDPRQPRVTTSEQVLSGIGSDAAAVESQVELIQSSAVAQKVITRLHLDHDREFTSSSVMDAVTGALRTLIGRGPDNSPEAVSNRLVYRFLNGLAVRRRGLTYVLEITYSAKEAQKAANIANAIAQTYVDDQRAAKTDITKRASGWLGDRINEMRDRVRDSERAVAAYKTSISSVNVTQGNPLISRQIEDLTQQLTLAHTRTAEAQARLDRVQQLAQFRGDPGTVSEALQSTVIANLRAQYAEVARTEAEQSAVLGARHPAIIGLRAQLANLQRQISAEINRILVGVRNDLQVAKSRETSLEKELTRLKNENSKLNEADVKLHELEREAQANRTLYEQFLSRAKETGEEQSLQLPDARVVSPALVPIKPARPSLFLLLAIAATGGGILSIALVMLLEHLRRGLRTTEEVERVLQVPALGVIPEIGPAQLWTGFRKVKTRTAASPGAVAQAVFNDPSSPFAAGVNKIRNRLRRLHGDAGHEVLAVVSALPGEGKSTLACNLALASAAAGVRTLLVDADVYTASTTRMFGIQGPGLWDVLKGKAVLRETIVQDADTGLHVLGAGANSTQTRSLDDLGHARQALFVDECHKQYDLVVVDSPAILPVAGNIPLLESLDRALLVIEWERTDCQALSDALNILGTQAVKIAGAVLNRAAASWYRLFDDGRYPHYQNYAASTATRMPAGPQVRAQALKPVRPRVATPPRPAAVRELAQ
jgi:exopolysaccharide transport family protein